MSSRVETQFLQYKSSLEKALASGSEVELEDILNALEELPMTEDILRSTLIGHTLNSVKKKMPNNSVGIKAKGIIAKWKTSCGTGESASTSEKSSSSKKIQSKKEDDENEGDSSSPRGDIDIIKMLRRLPESRVKIIEFIAGHLKADCDEEAAKFVAFCVEDAVNSTFDHESDKKGYKDKLKSLSFNLKQNEALRKSLIDGSLQPRDLVGMSANDLATEEIRTARGKIAEEGFMERRSDMYELKRSEIQAANGIDPNKGGEFVCKKCKGTKTTNYQMQTRSSDEPMTVFIRCLTCGNRWRF